MYIYIFIYTYIYIYVYIYIFRILALHLSDKSLSLFIYPRKARGVLAVRASLLPFKAHRRCVSEALEVVERHGRVFARERPAPPGRELTCGQIEALRLLCRILPVIGRRGEAERLEDVEQLRELPHLPAIPIAFVRSSLGWCYQLGGDNISVLSDFVSLPADNNH